MMINEYSKSEVNRAISTLEDLIEWDLSFENAGISESSNPNTVSALKAGTIMHQQLAKTLYNIKQRSLGVLEDGFQDDSYSSNEDV
jgi:hypothetical protein